VSGREHDDPVPLVEALAAVRAELGLPAGDPLRALTDRWNDIVGTDIAAHAHLDSVRDRTLTVTADGPIWASQLRYLEDEIVTRAQAVVGADAIASVRIRVGG
jgi:predicted nucleic acid-binding Zn ribbon protein